MGRSVLASGASLSLPRHYLGVRKAKKGVRVAAPRAPGGGDTFEVRASRDAMLQCFVGKAGPQGALGEHLPPLPGCVRVGVGFGRGREARLVEARLPEPPAQVAARVRLRAVAPGQIEM